MRPQYEVASVLQALGIGVEQLGLNDYQLRILRAIKNCRTAELGGHVDACTSCGLVQYSYNSCRNRHCPKCQGHKKHEWIQNRINELLPVPYFHVVFTLPQTINSLALHKPSVVYNSLFSAAWDTIKIFGLKKKIAVGMVTVLHTWGQNLSLHPHLHCIIPGAGINANGKLQTTTQKGKYLFPVKAMSKMYRAKYVACLRKAGITDQVLIAKLFTQEWVVYAKRPFGTPASVIEYLGRYTHKVAISNNRIQDVTDEAVTFGYKDYKSDAAKKVMTLKHGEFIRRFAQHIMPRGFMRIRHYGILSSTSKRTTLKVLLPSLQLPKKERQVNTMLKKCPCCKTATMVTIEIIPKRGPPKTLVYRQKKCAT